jgi:hypothetical protein
MLPMVRAGHGDPEPSSLNDIDLVADMGQMKWCKLGQVDFLQIDGRRETVRFPLVGPPVEKREVVGK